MQHVRVAREHHSCIVHLGSSLNHGGKIAARLGDVDPMQSFHATKRRLQSPTFQNLVEFFFFLQADLSFSGLP